VICYIRENSFIAKLAARKLNAHSVAIVIGKTIHLHNATRNDLLTNRRWLRHEMAHIRQFRDYGFLSFILMYLWESMLKGYHNNKYEAEARAAESNERICDGITIQ
jgi:uncharacterized protein (DUF2342 family)